VNTESGASRKTSSWLGKIGRNKSSLDSDSNIDYQELVLGEIKLKELFNE